MTQARAARPLLRSVAYGDRTVCTKGEECICGFALFFISIEASDPLERGSDDRPIGFWLFDHLVFVTTSSLHVHIEEPSNILHVAILAGSDSHHTL